MTEAVHNPVIRRRRHQVEMTDSDIAQPPSIDLGLAAEPNVRDDMVAVEAKHIEKDYLDRLAMDNDPITILINPGAEENPALVVPVWVNGEGAEVLKENTWIKLGWLPVGVEVTTKRKHVEALSRARPVKVSTQVIGGMNGFGEMPENKLVRNARMLNQFSIVEDRNPKGGEWLRRLMAER